MEAEKLPPTLGALIPHIQRANLIAGISKGYRVAINEIPSLVGNGWEIADGMVVPKKCLELPAPQAVMELVKCGCKGRCMGKSNCSCLKNNLSCTDFCKCEDCGNIKDYTREEETEDSDSDEDSDDEDVTDFNIALTILFMVVYTFNTFMCSILINLTWKCLYFTCNVNMLAAWCAVKMLHRYLIDTFIGFIGGCYGAIKGIGQACASKGGDGVCTPKCGFGTFDGGSTTYCQNGLRCCVIDYRPGLGDKCGWSTKSVGVCANIAYCGDNAEKVKPHCFEGMHCCQKPPTSGEKCDLGGGKNGFCVAASSCASKPVSTCASGQVCCEGKQTLVPVVFDLTFKFESNTTGTSVCFTSANQTRQVKLIFVNSVGAYVAYSNTADPNPVGPPKKVKWTYQGPFGTDFRVNSWPKNFPLCDNMRQSPINIDSHKLLLQKDGAITLINYDHVPPIDYIIENNGHTAQLGRTSLDVDVGVNIGNGINYQFLQLHFHWGPTSIVGSEHLIDFQAFPLEMHIVHANPNSADALADPNGLAVLGVLFEIGAKNEALQPIIDSLKSIINEDDTAPVAPFALETLVPKSKALYRYEGSLTTPPCSEAVIWTVFKETLSISEAQLAEFRQLIDNFGQQMLLNFRPVNPLFGRKVFFQPDSKQTHYRNGVLPYRNMGAIGLCEK
ncbi:Carbonic anhydrase [Nymphon striatum]|nr:Carbonic anhydrase [Nymphon striatum]